MAGQIYDDNSRRSDGELPSNYLISNTGVLSSVSNSLSILSSLLPSRTAAAQDALITPSPAIPLWLRQNNPQDCSNLIAASVDRATVEISRTIIRLNATFSQQLKAASSSATSGISSAQASANTTISIAFSSVTVANLAVTSANFALTSAQSSASTALSVANQSIAVATSSLMVVNFALASASSNITSVSSASSSDVSRLSSSSSSDVSLLSASITSLQASLSSAQASAFSAIAAAQSALASVTGSAADQASSLLASAASAASTVSAASTASAASASQPQTVFFGTTATQSQPGQTVFVTPDQNGVPLDLQASRTITPAQIAGIAIGGGVILVLLIGMIFFFVTKMRKRKQQDGFMNEKNLPLSPVLPHHPAERIEPPVVLALQDNVPSNTGLTSQDDDTTNTADAGAIKENTISTTRIPRKSSDSPRPTKSSLRRKKKDSIVVAIPDVSMESKPDPSPVIPVASPAVGVLFNLDFGFDGIRSQDDRTLQKLSGLSFHLDLPAEAAQSRAIPTVGLSQPESNPFIDPVERITTQPAVFETSRVLPVDAANTGLGINFQPDPLRDSAEIISRNLSAAVQKTGRQSRPLIEQFLQNEAQSVTPRNSILSESAIIVEPDYETEYNRYLSRQSLLLSATPVVVLPPTPDLVEEVSPIPHVSKIFEPTLDEEDTPPPPKSRIPVPTLDDDDPVRTSTVPEIDNLLRIVAQQNEATDKPLFWSDFRPMDPEVEDIMNWMAEQETVVRDSLPVENLPESLPITFEPVELMKEPEQEPEIQPEPPSEIPAVVLPPVEDQGALTVIMDRELSPLRRNPQIRNIASLLLEQGPVSLPEPQLEPEKPVTSLISPQEESSGSLQPHERQARGRSMVRTSDMIEARASYMVNIKAANKPNEKLKSELQDRTQSPLRRNPVDINTIPVPTRKPSFSDAKNIKRRSRTVSPPRTTPPMPSTTLIDRNDSPLRRNLVPADQVRKASLTTSRIEDTASPLRRNPSTSRVEDPASPLRRNPSQPSRRDPSTSSPLRIVEAALPIIPKVVSRSMSQPRPNGNAAFTQTLSKFRDLAAQNSKESNASSEVTQRAIAGIYIPGSLREQAVRNQSRTRENQKERERSK